jgi:hypothetical protein
MRSGGPSERELARRRLEEAERGVHVAPPGHVLEAAHHDQPIDAEILEAPSGVRIDGPRRRDRDLEPAELRRPLDLSGAPNV